MNGKDEDDDMSGKRDQTILEKIQDLGMNVLFSLSGWSMRTPAPFQRDSEVYFQGRNVNRKRDKLDQSQEELLKRFSGVIWMTYRRNFPALLKGIPSSSSKDQNYISDTGWGCTVRVGQMAFAEALRRHLSEAENKKFKNRLDLQCIINGFLDDDEDNPAIAPYSIQKISKLAFEEFKIFPGKWYNPNHICYILGMLHNEKKCIPGTENMKVGLFSSSLPIYFEDFLERMCTNDPQKNKRNTICGPACRKIQRKESSQVQNIIDDPDLLVITEQAPQQLLVCPVHHELQFSMLAFIVCVIGMDTPEIEYLNIAIKMMDFKYSLGMIGGKPKKALYFVGRIDDSFIILDPHYVQEGSSRENIVKQSQLNTYFCNKFQTFPSKNIDSSFSLMYYFKDLSQLEEFYQFIQKLKMEYPEHFFIMFEDSNKSRNSNLISTVNLQNHAEKVTQKKKKQTEAQTTATFNANFEVFEDETFPKESDKFENCQTNDRLSKQQEEQEDDFEII